MNSRLVALLEEYSQDHQHPMNRATHKLGVPLVLFHILAMLDWIHLYPTVGVHLAGDGQWAFSLGHLFGLVVLVWYCRLNVKLAAVVGCAALLCFLIAPFVSATVVVVITVIAWVLQFIGHGVYEKRAPAFFRNLLQILVGPLFFAALLTGDWPQKKQKAA